MTFTDGHSPDTVCTPSRYGLLTGRYSWRTTMKRGVMGAEGKCLIADGRTTLASFLQDNGYATAMVGKWHLGMDFPGTKGDRDCRSQQSTCRWTRGSTTFGVSRLDELRCSRVVRGPHGEGAADAVHAKKPNQIAIDDYRIKPPYQAKPVKPNDLEVAPDFVDIDCLDRFTEQAIKWLDRQAARGAERQAVHAIPLAHLAAQAGDPAQAIPGAGRFRGVWRIHDRDRLARGAGA